LCLVILGLFLLGGRVYLQDDSTTTYLWNNGAAVSGLGIFVVDDDKDGDVDGADIAAAITASAAGDTILLPNQSIAVTDGQVTLDEVGLTLAGTGPKSELTGAGSLDLLRVTASDVTIRDLKISNTTATGTPRGIECSSTSITGTRIENVEIAQTGASEVGDGIALIGCRDTIIRDVRVDEFDYNIYFLESAGTYPTATIDNATLTGSGTSAIHNLGSENLNILNSSIQGDDTGYYNDDTTSVTYLSGNDFNATTRNVYQAGGCLTSTGNTFATATTDFYFFNTSTTTCVTSFNDFIDTNIENDDNEAVTFINTRGSPTDTGSLGRVHLLDLDHLNKPIHVDWIPASDMTAGEADTAVLGSECQEAVKKQFGGTGGPALPAINCDLAGTNKDGVIYGIVPNPPKWDWNDTDGGTGMYVSIFAVDMNASPSGTLHGVFSAFCVGNAHTLMTDESWVNVSTVATDIVFTGANQYETRRTGFNMDPECDLLGSQIFWRYIVCDTGTPPTSGCQASTHNVSDVYIYGALFQFTRDMSNEVP
jgi:hypothetical protein